MLSKRWKMSEAATLDDVTDFGLPVEEIEFLRGKGYTLLRGLGEGQTRKAFAANFRNGDIDQLRTIKVPKLGFGDSATTIINLSRGDVNKRELLVANQINHPNVVSLVDSLGYDGKVKNAFVYFDGEDLAKRVKRGGPLNEQESRNIFTQIVNTASDLSGQGILHRDYKPSNILVDKNCFVKVDDLQNAAKAESIEPRLL